MEVKTGRKKNNKTKLDTFKTNVKSVLLYGSETWRTPTSRKIDPDFRKQASPKTSINLLVRCHLADLWKQQDNENKELH